MCLEKKYFSLFIVLVLLISMIGCEKIVEEKPKPKPEPIPIVPESKSTFKITGGIVDEEGDPLPDVKIIYVLGNTSDVTFSDANGKYTFYDVSIGSYTLNALKSNYTYGEIKIKVTEEGTAVPDMILKNLREIEGREETETTAEEIKKNGIEIVSVVDEEVSTGVGTFEMKEKEVKASIPEETEITIEGEIVTEEVVLSVAPLEVDEIPPPPEDEMPLGAAVFEPQNAKFSEPVKITVPLEIQLPPGIEIPLKKYEEGELKTVGTAVVDESGLGADSEVTEFGQFALQPKVTITVEPDPEPEEEVKEIIEVPAEQETFQAEVTDSVEFPGGLPEGVTVEYAISLIEKMKGTKIGVSKTITVESPLVKTVAKRAKTEEEWRVTWTVKALGITRTETITLDILIAGQTLAYAISYEYYSLKYMPEIIDETLLWWIDVTVNGAGGVEASASGTTEAVATLSDGESVRFKAENGANVSISFSKTGYNLDPPILSYSSIDSDQTETITATKKPENLSIECTINGAGDVSLALSGYTSDTGTVSTDGGSCTFSVISGQTYTVTPSKERYTFAPESETLTKLSSDAALTFTATRKTATISGTVSGANGVKVTLSGDATGTFDVVNAGDSYSFTVNVGGTYTVEAEHGSFVTEPGPQTFTNISKDETQDFSLRKKQKLVSITVNVDGADNVLVILSGDKAGRKTLDNGGSYTWDNLKAGGDYTVSASAPGVSFVKSEEPFNNLQTYGSFTFVAIQFVTISGTINDNTGLPISGVRVTISGPDAPAPETFDGSYSFTVKAGATYTVTPSHGDYKFIPSSSEVEHVSSNTTINFTGQKYVTISGTVSGAAATVTLSGTSSGSQPVSDGGSYSFRVLAGGTYTVTASDPTPLKEKYFFDPSNYSETLNDNVTNWDFIYRHEQGVIE